MLTGIVMFSAAVFIFVFFLMYARSREYPSAEYYKNEYYRAYFEGYFEGYHYGSSHKGVSNEHT